MSGERAPEVLFLCVHNAGRSQMAAALLARRADGRIVIHSAGSAPGDVLNPAVVAAMAGVDIDIPREKPTKLTDAMAYGADVIVTMDAGTRVRSTPASATRTGNSPILRVCRWKRSGQYETRSQVVWMRSRPICSIQVSVLEDELVTERR